MSLIKFKNLLIENTVERFDIKVRKELGIVYMRQFLPPKDFKVAMDDFAKKFAVSKS